MHSRKKRRCGFTLIEIMIVVAVIGILAMIAYPSYTEQIRKTRRTDAQGVLVGFASAMERFYTVNGTYLGAGVGGSSSGLPDVNVYVQEAPVDGTQKLYELQIMNTGTCLTTASTFCLRAIPKAFGPMKNDGFFEINNRGIKSWDRDNNGFVSASELTLGWK